MSGRVTRTALALVMLVMMSLGQLGCSDEHVVTTSATPSRSVRPSPSVPTKPSLLRYVSPTGDNDNPGTFARPWRTLAYALHHVYIEQALFVRGGTYREKIDHVRLHPGKPGRPITVLAYPGENPVLVGSISLRRPAYWLIDNLDVTGDPGENDPPSFMVKVVGGHAWTWQNSEFTDTLGRANVMITGWGHAEPSDFKFRANCLHGLPRPPDGSTNLFLGPMEAGAYGSLSRNVIFNDDAQPNVRIGSGAGAPDRVTLFLNTIYGGSPGIVVRGRPHRVRISRNVVGGSSAPAEFRFPGGIPRGTKVTNNIAVDAAQLLRPEVNKTVRGFGNVVLSGPSDFVDTARCDGFRSGLDAMIPYGAFAP